MASPALARESSLWSLSTSTAASPALHLNTRQLSAPAASAPTRSDSKNTRPVRACSMDSEGHASRDSWKTSRTRASSVCSKSSRATVQDLMNFAQQRPYEFEQSILLLRRTDSFKAKAEDRNRGVALHARSRFSTDSGGQGTREFTDSSAPSRARSKTVHQFDRQGLPRGRNCIVSI
ncbi:unnamed protein product [Symbiodinium natans]|uniref:Uncharacterized protein n=1 Tax=Symbiodinium natans TaxID=878477 RepID=A0A812KZ03_9DINO|nr:unnamed protein product [Symbiodinium natans]